MITVCGSHGSFEINELGQPEGPVPDEYEEIVLWDLKEWKAYWGQELPGAIDVLDLGGWRADGSYIHPEADYRYQCNPDWEG